MEEWIALVFNDDYEMIIFMGNYPSWQEAWHAGMNEDEDKLPRYCVPVKVEDYFEGMEVYLSDALQFGAEDIVINI